MLVKLNMMIEPVELGGRFRRSKNLNLIQSYGELPIDESTVFYFVKKLSVNLLTN
jgi:hypothetical protein